MKSKIASLVCRLIGHRVRREWIASDSMQGRGRFEHRCARCDRNLEDEYVSLYRPSSIRRTVSRRDNGHTAF